VTECAPKYTKYTPKARFRGAKIAKAVHSEDCTKAAAQYCYAGGILYFQPVKERPGAIPAA